VEDKLTPSIIATIIIVASAVVLLVFFMLVKFIESAYLLAYKKPLLVHFYPILKGMAPYGQFLLENEFQFYRDLSEKHRLYFQHRVRNFIGHYKFIGREGLEVTDEMRIKVAATWVMLTFGLRKYRTDMFEVVLLYPDIYQPKTSENYHYAEYNPAAKAVVFSWPHFEAGLDFKANNVNLGLHEFAHVVHTGSVRQNFGAAGALYADMFQQIKEYTAQPENMRIIMDARYFRKYAYTNEYEFIAVVLEYFFETPDEFREKLPQLYEMVGTMINYRKAA